MQHTIQCSAITMIDGRHIHSASPGAQNPFQCDHVLSALHVAHTLSMKVGAQDPLHTWSVHFSPTAVLSQLLANVAFVEFERGALHATANR